MTEVFKCHCNNSLILSRPTAFLAWQMAHSLRLSEKCHCKTSLDGISGQCSCALYCVYSNWKAKHAENVTTSFFEKKGFSLMKQISIVYNTSILSPRLVKWGKTGTFFWPSKRISFLLWKLRSYNRDSMSRIPRYYTNLKATTCQSQLQPMTMWRHKISRFWCVCHSRDRWKTLRARNVGLGETWSFNCSYSNVCFIRPSNSPRRIPWQFMRN